MHALRLPLCALLSFLPCSRLAQRHLFSADWMTLVYTLGAVQNTCTELEYVELMQEMGVVARLQELVRSGGLQQ